MRYPFLIALSALLLSGMPVSAEPPTLTDPTVTPSTLLQGSSNQTVTFSVQVDDPDGDVNPEKTKVIVKFEDGTKEKLTLTDQRRGRFSGELIIDTNMAQVVELKFKAKDLENNKAKLLATLPIVDLGGTLPSFADAVNFSVGTYPLYVDSADFDGDGNLDLVTADVDDNTVTVLLGDGAGDFKSSTHLRVGASPNTVVATHVNSEEDQNLDLVVANRNSGDLSILFGDGTGEFDEAISIAAGEDPRSVDVGDLNNDGIPDMVTANVDDSALLLFIGDGFGAFNQSTIIVFEERSLPRAVAIGDLNGDDNADLAVALRTGAAAILLGDGSGQFSEPTTYDTGSDSLYITIGDVNADNIPDVVTANSASNDVTILLGDGSGDFDEGRNFPTGERPTSVAIGDLNDDGNVDLVSANSGSNSVTILLGDGQGAFFSVAAMEVEVTPRGVIIGDLNNDTKPDVVTANWSSNNISMLLNTQ